MNFTTDQALRALSWKQPYAQLMLHGKIETRTLNTNYRGWVLICASKKEYTVDDYSKISGKNWIRIPQYFNKGVAKPSYILGKAIAIGRLVDSRPMTEEDEDKCFVEYRDGLYCHVYEDVKMIDPFDWKGKQGWCTVSEEIKSKIKFIQI